jgi:hypothetical protein
VCPSEMSTAWPGSGSWTWACPRTSMRAVPITLSIRGGVYLFAGRLALASSLVEQVQAVAESLTTGRCPMRHSRSPRCGVVRRTPVS